MNQGSALASYILGIPDFYYMVNSEVASRFGGIGSIYGQDSWKATHKLTLNFGLRYDFTFSRPLDKIL